ncbi:hypothetical protein C2G38_2203687 [Gigaspora rosea]|uniref:Uncharacterized protein n=1 Tax=Gigaspora rosea TaxID=44941 RepID=A0A397UPV7_9GLOM|nr:hypothetical protein C2G38_2203687 [Gigaspora rosea]
MSFGLLDQKIFTKTINYILVEAFIFEIETEDLGLELGYLILIINKTKKKAIYKTIHQQVPSFKNKEELESIEKIIKAELEEDLIFENEVVLWTDEVYKQLELMAKLVKKVFNKRNILLEETKIREFIEERCDRIVTNQKLMLNSILERLTRKIKIDRVCEDVGDDFKLYTEEKEVLDQVEIHFKEQFRKRNFDMRNLNQIWQKQYKPKEDIKEE